MNEYERAKAAKKGAIMVKAMVDAGLSEGALARKSGLPLLTVRKAMAGGQLSGVIYDGLIKACEEEVARRHGGRLT